MSELYTDADVSSYLNERTRLEGIIDQVDGIGAYGAILADQLKGDIAHLDRQFECLYGCGLDPVNWEIYVLPFRGGLRSSARGGLPITALSARVISSLDKALIRQIKRLPSGASLNASQIRALEKNLDAVLYDVLPGAVRNGNQRAINNALDLITGVGDSGGARFRSEFVNQIPGAQQKISDALRALGL